MRAEIEAPIHSPHVVDRRDREKPEEGASQIRQSPDLQHLEDLAYSHMGSTLKPLLSIKSSTSSQSNVAGL
jgi:hypothetical protein